MKYLARSVSSHKKTVSTVKERYIYSPWSLFIMVLVLSILVLFPLLIEAGSKNPLYYAMRSRRVMCCAAASVGCSAPLLFELLLDLSSIKSSTLLPRFLLIMGVMVPGLVIILGSASSLLYAAIYGVKHIMFGGALISYLIDSAMSLRQKRALLVCYFTGVATVFIGRARIIFPGVVVYIVTAILVSVLVIEAAALLYLYLRSMLTDLTEAFSSKSKKCQFVYVCCLVVYVLFSHAIWVSFGLSTWDRTSAAELIAYLLCDMVIAVVAICVPTRLARQESAVLMHKLEFTKQFIRYISHELRTPLSTVMLGTQLLTSLSKTIQQEVWKCDESSELPSLADNVASTSTNVYASCHSAVDVLNGLLMFDKIEDGHVRLRLKPHNLVKSISSWAEPFASQATEERIKLVYSGDECFPRDVYSISISIDDVKFTMAMRNLISNALKFTPAGGAVTISALLLEERESEGPCVRITVKDTGCGILPENHFNLFKDVVHFNATEARNGEGSGLGLYVSRHIISKHGGLLSLDSSGVPGEGCAFHVDLPIFRESHTPSTHTISVYSQTPSRPLILNNSSVSSASQTEDPEPSHSPTNVHKSTSFDFVRYSRHKHQSVVPVTSVYGEGNDVVQLKTALVVDDVKTCRKMLSRVLRPFFENVIEMDDGVGAVAAVKNSFETEPIDMIFLDSVMPNMSGIEACKIIREMGFGGPIIAVTGNIVPEDVEEFLAAGADKLVGKPMKLDTLVTTLQEFKVSTLLDTRRTLNSHSAMSLATTPQSSSATGDLEAGWKSKSDMLCRLEDVT